LLPCTADGITPLATLFTKSGAAGAARPEVDEGGLHRLDFANLPHDYAETLELVFVGITIVVSLLILVAFGQWWQK
jgi:hypothetical protein